MANCKKSVIYFFISLVVVVFYQSEFNSTKMHLELVNMVREKIFYMRKGVNLPDFNLCIWWILLYIHKSKNRKKFTCHAYSNKI